MKQFIAGKNEAGQRFDKYLSKLLREAPKSFIYKMLRKKNITLNGKKAAGSEMLSEGDEIRLFLSDETFLKFSGTNENAARTDSGSPGRRSGGERAAAFAKRIIYEDDDLLFWNKPLGVLSQPDASERDSIVEMLQNYLLWSGKLCEKDLATFRPAPVNRLDRNTSGIVLCGISLRGLQFLSEAIHERTVQKKYVCVIYGSIKDGRYDAYLKKAETGNKVEVSDDPIPGGKPITTVFRTLSGHGRYTLLEAELVTGRTHQIRAHLTHMGCGIVGDPKYGNPEVNREVKQKYGIQYQMLHAAEVIFCDSEEPFGYLAGKTFRAEIPPDFARILVST